MPPSHDPAAHEPDSAVTANFLPTPNAGTVTSPGTATAVSLVGTRFGEYEIVAEIARGGMGVGVPRPPA